MSIRNCFALVLFVILGLSSLLRADVPGAKKSLDDAKKNIESQEWDQADTNLKLAEAELDGVTGADKDAVMKDIAAARQLMTTTMAAGKTDTIKKQIEIQLKDLKESLGNRREAELVQSEIDKLLASDEGKLLTPAEVEGYRKQLATLEKVSAQKSSERAVDEVKRRLDSAESDAAEANGSDETANRKRMQVIAALDGIKDEIAILPNTDVGNALKARATALRQKMGAAEGAANAGEYSAMLERSWDSYKNEWDGWEKEGDAPSYQDFKSNQNETTGAIGAPKTVKLISRANNWLGDNAKGEKYEAVKSEPAVKARVDEVTKLRDTALSKMEARAEKIVASVESQKSFGNDDAGKINYLSGDVLRLALEGSTKLAGFQSRLEAVKNRITGAAAADSAASQKNLADLTKSAADAWPNISSGLSGKEDFNAANLSSGDTIHIKGKGNRIGWDFDPGDYHYAIKISGVPIAGKFDANVKAAYDSVKKKIGGELPEELEWDVYGKVEGTGKISERATADVTNGSGSRVGTVEGHDNVDCKVIRIFALHAGPLAVGPSGVADEKGAVAVTGADSAVAGGASGWAWRFIWVLLGLCGAGAVFAKVRPQVVAQTVSDRMGAGGTTAMANVNKNLDYIGLLLALLGVIWLLRGWIVYDLFPAIALIACGVFVASDFLKTKGVLKEELLAKFRPMGMLLAMATAALMVLHLLIGGWIFF